VLAVASRLELLILLLVPAAVAAETKCGAIDCKSKYGDGCPCCASYITTEEQCDLCRLGHNCSECAQVKTLPRQALAVTSTPQVSTRVVVRALLPQPACTADCNARQPTPDCPICCFVDKCKATYANCTKAARDACCQNYIGTGSCRNCLSANGCVVVPAPAPPGPAPTPALSPCGPVKPAQCKFWQQLFDATGGALSPWASCSVLRNDPCSCGGSNCTYTQPKVCVMCKDGDITAIFLSIDGLNGTMPSSIGELVALTALRIVDTNLHGTIPSELAKLTKLTDLVLDRNQLTGLVPALPFAQYNAPCSLSFPPNCDDGGRCNRFKCPLPPNASQCRFGTGTGVDCHK
jgi:hypothetical protein